MIGGNIEVTLDPVVAVIAKHVALAQAQVEGWDEGVATVVVVGTSPAALEALVVLGVAILVGHAHGRALN